MKVLAKSTPAVEPEAPVAEIREPTLCQKLMLDAPYGHDLCVISAGGITSII